MVRASEPCIRTDGDVVGVLSDSLGVAAQMINHQAAVTGRGAVVEPARCAQAPRRDEEDSGPDTLAGAMKSSISTEPFSQRLNPKKSSPPRQGPVLEQAHADGQEKPHLATLKFDTNNHNVFVPTAVKPPSTFYARYCS